MIVTMSGIPCSGKSTVAKKLSALMGWKRESMGDIFKEMAGDIPLNTFYKELENNPDKEKECDQLQKEWGEKYDDFILDARIAFHFMPKKKSYNVFFDLPLDEAARRAYKREKEKGTEQFKSLEDAKGSIEERISIETKRYRELYGIDHLDKSNYDYIVDANRPIETVLEDLYSRIRDELKARGELYKIIKS
ncbi:MAG: AAA family ATPase [Candidatus Woesearchaeota archaeon]